MRALLELPDRPRCGGREIRTTMVEGGVDTLDAGSGKPDASGATPTGRLVAGRYRLRSLLGRGGMGRVFLADDELLHRPVALKQRVTDGAAEDATAAAGTRMVDEARAAARVNHHGVVRVLDVVHDGGALWMVMEALSGRTLAEVIDTDGQLPVSRVTRLAVRLLNTVQAVHRAGVIHRDIKPSNVHLGEDGRVVLIDFGIACSVREPHRRRPAGTFVGSPPYVSPELLHGERPGPASDLFSLGATLFAAVEGRAPFDKGDLYATITAVIEGAPAPFVHAGPLRPVIAGLLATDPRHRLTVGQARDILSGIARRDRQGAIL
jgi:serine/threonine protein kinase